MFHFFSHHPQIVFIELELFFRDIPMPLVTSGVEHGNLRELALARMNDFGTKVTLCIVCGAVDPSLSLIQMNQEMISKTAKFYYSLVGS